MERAKVHCFRKEIRVKDMCVLIVKSKLGLCTNQGCLSRLTSPKRWAGAFLAIQAVERGLKIIISREPILPRSQLSLE